MKKALFASSALAAASIATAGMAAEAPTASVGGYMMIGLVYQDSAGNDPEIGILRDGEIHFNVKGSSDNGLTYRCRVELEAFGGDTDPAGDGGSLDYIDENWCSVGGSWGTIMIGSNDSASEAHEKGIFYGPGSRTGYFDAFYSVLGSTNGGDIPVIRYSTPNISGFAASIDWGPNAGGDNAGDGGLVFGNNAQRWSVGASYTGTFSGVDIGLGGGYLDGDGANADRWHIGGQIGYQGFSLGVHFDSDSNGTANDDGALAIGLQYKTGPWTIGGGWAFATSGTDTNNYGVWVTYALSPGVTATLGYEGNDQTGGFDNSVSAYLRIGF